MLLENIEYKRIFFGGNELKLIFIKFQKKEEDKFCEMYLKLCGKFSPLGRKV